MRGEAAGADVVVIGAGPAGLGAADLLGEAGRRVLLVDEYPVAGGRLRGQQYRLPDGRWFVGRERAEQLLEAVQAHPGIALEVGTSVVGIARVPNGWRVDTVAGGVLRSRLAARCLIATGAVELPLPLPGWTLPGVITAGGAQTLQGTWGVAPGRRGVMVGLTPLAMAVSQELAGAGVALAGVVMPPPLATTRHLGTAPEQWARLANWSRSAPAWARAGARLLAAPAGRRLIPRLPTGGMVVSGVRFRLGVAALEILGGPGGVEAIRLSRMDAEGGLVGTPWDEGVDFVCVAAGLRPLAEVLSAAGAAMTREPRLGGTVPVLDGDGRTTAPGLYAAGSATGVEGAEVAVAQGRLAAAAILADAGEPPDGYPAALRMAVREARARAPLAFQEGVEDGRAAVAAVHARTVAREQAEGGGPGAAHAPDH